MQVPDAERIRQRLSDETVNEACEAFEAQGFVVLEGLFDEALMAEMSAVCEGLLSRRNRPVRALPYELLNRRPYRQLARNVAVIQMIRALRDDVVFRENPRWIRSAAPGGAPQHVHRDCPAGDKPVIAIDVFLTPFSVTTGATEIWPDSRFTREQTAADYQSVQKRAEASPCEHIEGPAGSVSFRDERAWHRAGINRTSRPRLMLNIG